jgi:RimJ/RimL family protein N-acetyltransferase
MIWPDEVTLEGTHATLRPLRAEHAADLAEAVKDGELWRLWYTFVPSPEDMDKEIARRLAEREAGSMLPFTVFGPAGDPVGMTTYMHIDAVAKRVEIGATWYRRSVQRTPVNTECKRMLLAHAFETLECIAVEFRTNAFNFQSRRAIERLGARQDGILRSHQRNKDGTLRDTVVYSITAAEWPTVRTHLDFQLERPR